MSAMLCWPDEQQKSGQKLQLVFALPVISSRLRVVFFSFFLSFVVVVPGIESFPLSVL